MRRSLVLLAILAVLAAACSTGDDDAGSATTAAGIDPTTTEPGPTVTTETTDGSDQSPSTTAPGETATTSDRPMAPDFTLGLGNGGSYTLSEGDKPVYLVFWAEW